MRWIQVTVLFLLLLSSCKDKNGHEQRRDEDRDRREQIRASEKKARQIKEQILALCNQYNAMTDWEQKLYKGPFDKLYTIQIQDVFLRQKGQPYLFFVGIYDIKKVAGRYLLIANLSQEVETRRTIYLHLRLICESGKIEKVVQKGLSTSNRYALFATINSIEKPDLYLRAAVQSERFLDYDFFAEIHPEDIYDFFDVVLAGPGCVGPANDNTFIITGKCEDLLFVGRDDWMHEPSDYDIFMRIFDTNQP